MRKELFRTVMATGLAAQALAAFAAAPAQAQTAPQMAMGRAATPPAGYLDFCARRPDQCGLTGATNAQGEPLSGEALGRALYAQYFWPVALGGASPASVIIPASGPAPYDQVTQTQAAQGRAAPAWDDTPAYAAHAAAPVAPANPQIASVLPDRPVKVAEQGDFKSVALAPLMTVAALDLSPFATGADTDLATALALRPVRSQSNHYAVASLVFTYRDRPAEITVPQTYSFDLARALRISLMQAPAVERLQERGFKPAPILAKAAIPAVPPVAVAAAPVPYDTPAYAVARLDAPTPLTTDRALTAELDRVNLMVNRAIRFVLDRKLYGREDYWHMSLEPGGPRAGDCKDYVLEKRRALIEAGVPAENLSIAIVRTGWNEPHAVLLVNTDQGEMVLDSLSSWVQPWWKVHYKWVERQAPGKQLNWVSLL